MDAAYLKEKHEAGLTYADYLATGTDAQRENWTKIYNQATLTDAQQKLIAGFTREVKIIGMSGIWCGDCVQQCPLVAKIAAANPEVLNLRWVDRDEHSDLQEKLTINAGKRVPVFVFCAEDYEMVGWYGDRVLSRYRTMAAKQLGVACPMPGAPVSDDEVAATLQDWLDQIERAHLLLRLSGRLRQKHGD